MTDGARVQEATPNREALAGERETFRAYVARLTYATGTFELALPSGQSGRYGDHRWAERRREVHPGFLVHSLLGIGLRAAACIERPHCPGTCRRPGECAYGRLLEPRPGTAGPPLSGIERAPVPLAIDAPWDLYRAGEPLHFKLILLGRAAEFRDAVTGALSVGLMPDNRNRRAGVTCITRGWQEGRAADRDVLARSSLSRRSSVRIEFLTPVRIVREKKELEAFDLGSAVRDAGFRLATWGHYHQGLPWPDPWRFLQQDAAAVRTVEADIRPIRFRRYSGRQRRAIPMKGLLGAVRLSGVSADLALLLGAAALCGLGKGASIGLGRIRLKWD